MNLSEQFAVAIFQVPCLEPSGFLGKIGDSIYGVQSEW